MKIKKAHVALAAIFLATFLFRMYFALQTPNFTPESYFDIRQIINIRYTGSPIYHDSLSFSGREFFFFPLFHYIIAGISFLFPLQLVLKLAPNLFASITVIIAYLIVMELTKDKIASLASAFASGFVPIFIFKTVNTVSPYCLLVPLFFFLIYCIMRIEEKIFVWLFIIGLLALVFLHPLSMLLIAGLLVYITLVKLEQIKHNPAETELILFSTLLATWITFLIFRTPLLFHGPSLIWQNIPASVLNQYFSRFDVIEDIFKIGIIPFVAGLFVIYKYILREHEKNIYLFFGFASTILLLLWLRLINVDIGLMFLGILFSLLLGQFVKIFLEYLNHTRFAHHKRILTAIIFAILIITLAVPSMQHAQNSVYETPSENEIKALLWLKANSDANSVVAAGIDEGSLITAVAQRKTIADSNFLLVKDASQRVLDIDEIYSTPYEIEAVRLLNQYNVNYILLSQRTIQFYSGRALTYAADKNCFELVFESKDIEIYKSLCGV